MSPPPTLASSASSLASEHRLTMASIHPITLPISLSVPLPSPARSSIQMSPPPAPADPLSTLRALLPRRRSLPPRLFAQLHALLLTSGLARHSPNFSLLLRLSSSLRVSHRLRLLLCSPLRPTAFLANSLLLQPSLHLPSALSLFSLLFLFSFSPLRPNAFTYPPLLRASPPSTAVALATHSLKFLGAGAASQDRVLGAALLDVFARCGRIASCRRVFDRIVDPDLPAWNALLSAYARRARDAACAGSAAEVLDLFRRMISTKVRPNEITLVSVIGACGELGALGHGVWAHAYALKRRLAVNCFVATALVETYARCGRLDLAEQVFAAVADVDTRCYNAILHGLAVHGHGRAALALFGRMRGEGVPVDGVTVLAVMCACAHAGLVDQGQQCFDRMEVEFGVAPRIEHYGCMVDMLGRAGQLDDADKLIRGMDIPLNAAICRSLIRACGIHGKLELGERMVGELMRLEPEHGGNYVLQSSLYARMSRWEDAKKARKEMKTMGIDKSPGSSLLDIDGVLHEFLMGDKTHPASKEIYAMVGEIEARLSECGHRLSTTAVLFDVEEEDKADALSYHSERLAVAFALIASAPGTPIRIIKNLRVCIDCHESTKIVSRVYCREIVMRDRTRFHHFRDGQCSCADFCAAPIVGMNVSLMWNSAEFYQISKLCMTPASCVLEVVFDHVHYSWDTKLSIMVVLIGVAVCTITDVSVNAKGLIAAVIAVWSTALQQYYSLNSFNLLGHTAPTQAGSLPLVGPFVDFLFTGKRVDHFNFTSLALTVVVLFIGFLFFGKEDQNFQVVLGMVLAVLGMIWYGNASAKPGGKERRSILPVRSDRPNGASEEKDGGEK